MNSKRDALRENASDASEVGGIARDRIRVDLVVGEVKPDLPAVGKRVRDDAVRLGLEAKQHRPEVFLAEFVDKNALCLGQLVGEPQFAIESEARTDSRAHPVAEDGDDLAGGDGSR